MGKCKVLALILAFALASGVAGCSSDRPIFTIVSGSENKVLEPIVREFCASKGTRCDIKYLGSLDIALSLKPDTAPVVDAVWPAASIWIDVFDTARRVEHVKSIAQMPVILGVRKTKAQQLGWIGRAVENNDILKAVDSKQLEFLMTSVTQSNSGASAYLSMLAAALGNPDTIEAGGLDRADVRDRVKRMLRGVTRSAGSSGWLADLYVKAATDGKPFDAMWNYEAVLKETNDRLKAAGHEQLYAIYPADGIAMADSPLGFLFDDYIAGGPSAFPLIVGYENQLIEWVLADPERWQRIEKNVPSKPVLLYPQPTVYSAHPLIVLNKQANTLIDALLSPQVQEIAWQSHGFRGPLGAIGKTRNPMFEKRLQSQLNAILPMPEARAMMDLLQRIATA